MRRACSQAGLSRSAWYRHLEDKLARDADVIDTSLPGAWLVRMLEQIKASQGVPVAIRCDNGPELISRQFVDWCEENAVEIKYIQPGKPKTLL